MFLLSVAREFLTPLSNGVLQAMEGRTGVEMQSTNGQSVSFAGIAMHEILIHLQTQRLTPEIRRQFVITLRTPALLSLFAKDPISMGMAQAALRTMALLEPNLIMPQLLERAYSGLEVVNETHRTTAVLSMLSCVALPLVSSRIWLGGQKHLVPLLDLCLPGIDLVGFLSFSTITLVC